VSPSREMHHLDIRQSVTAAGDVKIEPRLLSFDIETHGTPERLLAISMYAAGIDEVLIVDGSARAMPDKATRCADEFAALDAFCDRVRRFDPMCCRLEHHRFRPDGLTAHRRACSPSLRVGQDSGGVRIRKAIGYFGSGQASVPGRLVLDGIDLLRGAFIRMDDYSLDSVARKVLGEGKVVTGTYATASPKSRTTTGMIWRRSRSMRARTRGWRLRSCRN